MTREELDRLSKLAEDVPAVVISQEAVEEVCRAISDQDSTDEQKMLSASEIAGIDQAIAQHTRAQRMLARVVLGTIGPVDDRRQAEGLHQLAVALMAFGWKLRGEHDKRVA